MCSSSKLLYLPMGTFIVSGEVDIFFHHEIRKVIKLAISAILLTTAIVPVA